MSSSAPIEDPKVSEASEAAAPAEGEVSKKGAKKAEAKAKKEAEKARKAAEREAAAQASGGGAGAGPDLAVDNYGDFTASSFKDGSVERVRLEAIGEQHIGKSIRVRGWIQNSRKQGAKMVFLELRKGGDWTIQAIASASADGTPVSKQMVKWVGGLNLESLVTVEATVQKPLEPVKSTKVSGFELHITKMYLVSAAPEQLPMSLATASVAVGGVNDEEDVADAAESKWTCFAALNGLRGCSADIRQS